VADREAVVLIEIAQERAEVFRPDAGARPGARPLRHPADGPLLQGTPKAA